MLTDEQLEELRTEAFSLIMPHWSTIERITYKDGVNAVIILLKDKQD